MIKRNSLILYTLLAILACWTLSCGSGTQSKEPDVSSITLPYTSYPFYRDFAALDTAHLEAGIADLARKYPDFLDFYLTNLTNLKDPQNEARSRQNLIYFLTHKDYRSLFDTVNTVFPDTKAYDTALLHAFTYAHYYDSSIVLPTQVYYFVSGLNLFTAVTHNDTILGIGLDMFLGNYPPYAAVGVPEYALLRFTADNIPVWAMRAIYQNTYPDNADGKDLLALMVVKGKEQYFLEKTLPGVPEHIRLGFTQAQWQWCKENEALIYNFFIQQNLLYEKNLQKIMRFVNDGPQTAGMPPESPGNIGSYIGWRIVSKYMEKTGAGMHRLLQHENAQELLTDSRYKP